MFSENDVILFRISEIKLIEWQMFMYTVCIVINSICMVLYGLMHLFFLYHLFATNCM